MQARASAPVPGSTGEDARRYIALYTVSGNAL